MRLAIMDTNVFNTIIAAVKGAVSASISRPMYKNIRLEFRKKNKAVTAIATDGFRLFVEHATCCEVEEDFDCYIKPMVYRADFVYERATEPDCNGTVYWLQEVEDAKGAKTKDYLLKKKLMQDKYGITIREV